MTRRVYDEWKAGNIEPTSPGGAAALEAMAAPLEEATPMPGAALPYACIGGVKDCANGAASHGPCESCVNVLAAMRAALLEHVVAAGEALRSLTPARRADALPSLWSALDDLAIFRRGDWSRLGGEIATPSSSSERCPHCSGALP